MTMVSKNIAPVQSIVKKAYDRLKSPAVPEFTRKEVDVRGKPFWEI